MAGSFGGAVAVMSSRGNSLRELIDRQNLQGRSLVIFTIMYRAAVIEKLKATQETLNKLLALLESSEADRFAAHIYVSLREYRHACDQAGKSGKQIERCILSTLRTAQSLGFEGDLRAWEHLLRIHE